MHDHRFKELLQVFDHCWRRAKGADPLIKALEIAKTATIQENEEVETAEYLPITA